MKNIEKLADKQHEIWSHWMKYQFSKCEEEIKLHIDDDLKATYKKTGRLIIPNELVNRWFSQMHTPYLELTENEKESDREQVRKFAYLL